MAKGKNAVALFEVIRKDARFAKKQPPDPLNEPHIDFSPKMVAKAVDLWRKKNSDPETWSNTPVKVRQPVTAHFEKFSAGWKAGMARSAKIAEGVRAWIVRQDAIIFGAAAAGVIIGVLLVVRHVYHPAPPAGSAEQALLSGPAHPSVLAVSASREPSGRQQSIDSDPMAGAQQQLSPELQADVQQASARVTGAAETSVARPGERIVNMHYVLVQSYLDEKTARQACDFLNNNGVPCTIERGIRGWRPDFYEVVGLQGFARASGTQYTEYRQRIIHLSAMFTKVRFKRFMPQAIKWMGDSAGDHGSTDRPSIDR